MIAYAVPGELVIAAFGVLFLIVVYGTVVVALLRERVTRLEEWIRLYERLNGKQR